MLRLTVLGCLFCIAITLCDFGEAFEFDEANDSSDIDSDRIINGNTTAISDCPHVVSLQNDKLHFCGASIINKNMILSAAHCFSAIKSLQKITARVGSSLWNVGGQVKNVVAVLSHPKYDPKTKFGDIALVKVGSPMIFSSAVKPIALADGVPTDGKIGFICGFGVTDPQGFVIPTMLKSAHVTTISRANCTKPPWDYGDSILPSMICARAEGVDSCQGDSGGPLMSKSSGKLWGVVSWGRGCARDKYPGVYCVVAAFKKWITSNMDNF
ncbi:trypsin alpha-3-like [Episyrphus balteatus]|uniref:trypsin alpha-3-like n=1 Tax=Episyrphus balteatus TaxID=286459 RepID=UPI0024851F55|nr:trypsin alpha-3-like [Episyrphus balteatus]